MRLILVGGILSWQDGGLTLPVMAGGQEDPFDAIFGTGEEGEIDTADLAGLVGRTLLDLNTNFFGIVRTRTDRRTGRTVYWLSDPNSGRAQDLRTGATLVDPNTRIVTNVSASTTGSAADSIVSSGGKLSEADVRRLFGEEDGGGTTAGRTIFPSEIEANQAAAELARARAGAVETPEERAARLQFDIDQAAADREARAEQNRLAEEAALKRQRLGTLSDLIQSFVGAQSQARETLANLQPDPFRFAAVAGGIAPFGTTPQQGFQTQLQQFAGAAVPQFDPSGSAASLDPIIAQLTGAQAPQAPQIFGGLAGGGTVPAPFNTASARLVGEAGPEVMVTSPQGVTILPLGKGAQEGGFFPFQPIEFDRESLLPALSPLFGGLTKFDPVTGTTQPFTQFPTLGGGTGGFPSGTAAFAPTFEALGTRPRLLRNPAGTVFFRDDSGQLRGIPDMETFNRLGFNFSDVVNVPEQALSGFGSIGAPLTADFNRQPQMGTPSAFTKFSAPIIEPTTGTVLPAPFLVARQLNKLRLTDPFKFNLLLSAYKNSTAQIPPEAVLASIQSSLPFGAERSAVGLR